MNEYECNMLNMYINEIKKKRTYSEKEPNLKIINNIIKINKNMNLFISIISHIIKTP